MQKFYLILLLCCITFATSAQQLFSVLPYEDNVKILSSVSNTNGQRCLLAFNARKSTLYAWVIDSNGALLAQKTSDTFVHEAEPTIVGANAAGNTFRFYSLETNSSHNGVYYYQGEQLLREIAVDLDRGAISQNNTALLTSGKHYKHIAAFSDNGINYALFYNKKVDSLQVSRYENLGQIKSGRFRVDNSYFNSKLNLEQTYLATGHENPLPTKSKARVKAYVRDSKLYLIFDAPTAVTNLSAIEYTHIIKLDIDQQQASISKLPAAIYGNKHRFNSYLYQDVLFRFGLSKDSLTLRAYDLETLRPLISYKNSVRDAINLRATLGTSTYRDSRKKLGPETKAFLQSLSGAPAIAAYTTSDSTLELSLGTFLTPVSGAAAIPSGAPGGGSFYVPGAVDTEGTQVQFKAVLHYPSLRIVKEPVSQTAYDLVDEYIFQQHRNRNAGSIEIMIEDSGKVYLITRDKKKKTFDILAFSAASAQ
jgi:hypothetical protein